MKKFRIRNLVRSNRAESGENDPLEKQRSSSQPRQTATLTFPNNPGKSTTASQQEIGVANSQQARHLILQLEALVNRIFVKAPKTVRQNAEVNQLLLQVLALSKLGNEVISENAEIYSALPRVLEKCIVGIDAATLLEDEQARDWARMITDIIANYSDSCEFFARTLATEVQSLIKWLLEIVSSKGVQNSLSSHKVREMEDLVDNCLMSLHNVTKFSGTKPVFQRMNAIEAVKFYLTCSNEILQCLAMIFTARIVEDAASVRFAEEYGIASAFVRVLSSRIDDVSGKSNLPGELSAAEVADGMRLLLITDANKSKFVAEGVLPLLEIMLSSKNENEQVAAIQCLWTLAFSEAERVKITGLPSIAAKLGEISKSTSSDRNLRLKAANALVFISNGKSRISRTRSVGSTSSAVDEQEPVKNEQTTSTSENYAGAKAPLIFISYCQREQPMVLRIRESLRNANFDCWIDTEAMHGSTLQAMADAIERSTVALMCYSENYKNSNNCRSEAEYIFQLRKPIVPVKMQKQYQPDGWLGIIIGARFYIDMSLASIPYVEAVQKLCAEITNQLHIINKRQAAIDGSKAVAIPETSSSMKQPEPRAKKEAVFAAWSNDDVKKWLAEISLSSQVLEKLDGNLLWALYEMKSHAPEAYYAVMSKHFGEKDLHGLLVHLAALDRLWQTVDN